MWYKISKNKTNHYTIFTIVVFFGVYLSGFLYYYCFFADPAVYAQQQSEGNVNDISKRPTATVNTTSQEPEPQIAVPSISTKDLNNNTIDIESSGVDDKYVEELFEAEPEDNTETGSENKDNEKIDKQGTKNLEEKVVNKQEDRNQQQRQSSDESASTDSIAEEEGDSIEKLEKGEKQEQADNKEEQEDENKSSDKTGDKDRTDSDKGGEQKIEGSDEMEEGEGMTEEEGEGMTEEEGEGMTEEEGEGMTEEEGEGMTEEEGEGMTENDEPKDKPSDDTPLELPFP
jgi:hypothetical protein